MVDGADVRNGQPCAAPARGSEPSHQIAVSVAPVYILLTGRCLPPLPPPPMVSPHVLLQRFSVPAFALVAVLLMSGAAPLQPDESLVEIQDALQDSDPDGVLNQVDGRVEIVLFGQGGTYRPGQAEHVLRDFFRRYPPDRVDLGSELSSSSDGRTAIGRYWTEDGGMPLQVRVLHRQSGSDWTLVSMRIERQSFGRVGGR